MKIYCVGGAVRDTLLGLPVSEKDFVVVDAVPEDLLSKGYKQVGKSFPVFLHPQTGEEYALSRAEKKIGKGYHGFLMKTDKIPLEVDLLRRDLTINAMAMDKEGNLIDPYGGQQDIAQKKLRHVSEAFIEDPVRILRISRFLARFHYLGFTIADETMVLMRQMVDAGEVDALVPERVQRECLSALREKNPECFFETLKTCGALPILFPEIENHFDMAMQNLKKFETAELRLIAFLQALSETEISACVKKKYLPIESVEKALLLKKNTAAFLEAHLAEAIITLLENMDAIRRPERFLELLQVMKGLSEKALADFEKYLHAITDVKLNPEEYQDVAMIKIKLHHKRVEAIEKISSTHP